jgi:hypothetical protein
VPIKMCSRKGPVAGEPKRNGRRGAIGGPIYYILMKIVNEIFEPYYFGTMERWRYFCHEVWDVGCFPR